MTTMIDDLRGAGLIDDAGVDRIWRHGHFAYESGDHGDAWLALGLLFADPRRLRDAAGRLADKLRPYAPDVVCGPLVGGALVGQWVAYDLSADFVYVEPRSAVAETCQNYRLPPELRPAVRGKRAVVVDDAINAGAAALAAVEEVEAAGGSVVAVAALVLRTPHGLDVWGARGLPIEYLVGLGWNTWPAGECPLCRAGVPIERPT